jgi:hypothetical protein
MAKARKRQSASVALNGDRVAVDVLWLNSNDLRQIPLIDRMQTALEPICAFAGIAVTTGRVLAWRERSDGSGRDYRV